jgi:hypothetical protein
VATLKLGKAVQSSHRVNLIERLDVPPANLQEFFDIGDFNELLVQGNDIRLFEATL